jgi:hypothetical protein
MSDLVSKEIARILSAPPEFVVPPVMFEREYTWDDPGMWVLRAHDHRGGEHWVNEFRAVDLGELIDVVFHWIDGGARRIGP